MEKKYYDWPYLPQSSSINEIEESVIKYGDVTTTIDFASPVFDEVYNIDSGLFKLDGVERKTKRKNILIGVLFNYSFRWIGDYTFICKVSLA